MTLRGILRATTAILFLVGTAAGEQSPPLNCAHLDWAQDGCEVASPIGYGPGFCVGSASATLLHLGLLAPAVLVT